MPLVWVVENLCVLASGKLGKGGREGEGDIVNWEGEGDIVNCKSDLGGLGDLVRSAYAFYFMKTIHYVPWWAPELRRLAVAPVS